MSDTTANIHGKAAAGHTYDAIVIGSGISGGWAAKELTEKGLKTLLLERGKDIVHVKDYKTAMKAPWELPHRGKGPQALKHDYPIMMRRPSGMSEIDPDYWVNNRESPYTEVKRYNWIRGYHVGGRSLMWGRQSYRWSDIDFEGNIKEGVGIDWPIRYKDMAPWYDHVERFAGISGARDGLVQLPDGQFMPAMEMNCVEKDVVARMKEQYKGTRPMIIGRTANITLPLPGRTNCQYRNRCVMGCPFGGYFSTQSSTLPAAVATGNLTLRPFSIVKQILYDKDTKKAKGVEIIDAENNQTYEYYAKIVFVNASTFNSAWVLMNSATDIWPDGLGSSSEQLGYNVMDHHMSGGAQGEMEGYEDKYYFGRRANGIYIPRYRNIFGDKRDYLRGFGYQGQASREGWSREVAEMNIGGDFKDQLSEPGKWTMGITGFGEILPDRRNRVTLDKNTKDKWGLNVLSFDVELQDNEKKMGVDMRNDAMEMLASVGAKNIKLIGKDPQDRLGAIHEMGTVRMGNDPKTSVLNKWNQVWDAQNVFVTDGACMASSSCVNPSLTYMAMTARAADHAVSELKKGNLG